MYKDLTDNEVETVERLLMFGHSADLITHRIIEKREVGLYNRIKPVVDMIKRAKEEDKNEKEVKL